MSYVKKLDILRTLYSRPTYEQTLCVIVKEFADNTEYRDDEVLLLVHKALRDRKAEKKQDGT